jgi:hypothetical protein
VIARQWKNISAVTVRAAIVTEGTHSKVCRFVTHNVMADRYAVYQARGGRCGKLLATGRGTQQTALLAGCADRYEIDKPHLWRKTLRGDGMKGASFAALADAGNVKQGA